MESSAEKSPAPHHHIPPPTEEELKNAAEEAAKIAEGKDLDPAHLPHLKPEERVSFSLMPAANSVEYSTKKLALVASKENARLAVATTFDAANAIKKSTGFFYGIHGFPSPSSLLIN
jgi:hypothetical protein